MQIDRIRELGHQIITLITRSGLSIEDQSILMRSLESAFTTAVKQVAASEMVRPDNSN